LYKQCIEKILNFQFPWKFIPEMSVNSSENKYIPELLNFLKHFVNICYFASKVKIHSGKIC
jgi:hypothetical protein